MLYLCRIHNCCYASPPQCSSAAIFTADLVYHSHYPTSPLRLGCCPPESLLHSSSHYLPLSRVLRCSCLSTFLYRIFSLQCVVMYWTAWSALLRTIILTLRSDLLTTLFSSILTQLFSVCVMFLICLDPPCFPPHFPSLWSAPIWSSPSALSDPIYLLHIWYAHLR